MGRKNSHSNWGNESEVLSESEVQFLYHALMEKIQRDVRIEMETRETFVRNISKPNSILQEALKSEESGSLLLGYNGANREQLIADQLWAREKVASLLGMVDILQITRQAFMDETLDIV